MNCPKCGTKMHFVSVLQGSRYPMGHYKCPKDGFEVSKK